MGRHHPADVAFGKAAFAKGWVEREAARDAMRTVKVLRENGETTTLSRVLFEQDLLTARQVRSLQTKLGQREALCECGSRIETHGKKPGSKARCPDCKARVDVPGSDLDDPFRTIEVDRSTQQSGGQLAVGLVTSLALAGVLGAAARESYGGHMGFGAAVTSGVAGALALLCVARGAALGAAGVLLAAISGLSVAAVLGNPAGAPAYTAFGVSAHMAMPGLIALHLVVACVVLRQSLFAKGPDGVMAWTVLVSLYPLAFFGYRCLPSTDPSHYFTGPSVLAKVPWMAQPGSVALLYLFPLMALMLGGAGLIRSLRGRKGGILTHAGFAASLLILSGFGLALGTSTGQLPTQGNVQLDRLVAERVGPHWGPPPGAPASVAAAIQVPRIDEDVASR